MTQLTDDQIIAAAGEPVAYLNPYGGVIHQLKTGLDKQTHTIKLYPADAILSAAKPMRERIAELEQAREFDAARTGVLARLVDAAYPDSKEVQLCCIGTILGSVRIATESIIKERDDLRAQLASEQATSKKLRELLGDCASKLESQLARNPDLPEAYRTLVRQSFEALSLPADDTALRQAIEAEREACAKVCDEQADRFMQGSPLEGNKPYAATECAAAIRARSNL